jgi:hypothetical protein
MSLKKFAIAASILLAIFVLINLGLHFGQKSHDRLNYSVNQAFPPDKPFVAGEIYATTLAAIMENELNRGFGWRPNDFFLWGMHVMADNNANRQLGIIMAVRETTRVFKDHLTKVSSNEYDPNLVIADTDFRSCAASAHVRRRPARHSRDFARTQPTQRRACPPASVLGRHARRRTRQSLSHSQG